MDGPCIFTGLLYTSYIYSYKENGQDESEAIDIYICRIAIILVKSLYFDTGKKVLKHCHSWHSGSKVTLVEVNDLYTKSVLASCGSLAI